MKRLGPFVPLTDATQALELEARARRAGGKTGSSSRSRARIILSSPTSGEGKARGPGRPTLSSWTATGRDA